jgi:Galactose oxidase, central domain
MSAILEPTRYPLCRIVLSVLCVVAGHSSIALAQPSGTFTSTGAMITSRAGHGATLLPNGKVLITGGVSTGFPQSVLSSAEIYDPSAGMFTATGNMVAPRTRHSAPCFPTAGS